MAGSTKRRYSAIDIFEESFSSFDIDEPIKEKEEESDRQVQLPFCSGCTFFIGDLIRLPKSKVQKHAVVFLGRPVSEVHILGYLTKSNSYGDCCIYVVDDGTGSIQLKYIPDESTMTNCSDITLVDGALREGTLVHVVGMIVFQRDTVTIVAKELAVLQDLNLESKHVLYLDWLYETKYKVMAETKQEERIRKLATKPKDDETTRKNKR